MQVAQAFREIGFEGRSPQAMLNCLQDVSSTNYLRPRALIIGIKLLEHALENAGWATGSHAKGTTNGHTNSNGNVLSGDETSASAVA